ncbi:MAG TPA: mannose-1-phosphate guanylyltransferase, partial [Syntrophales bacterium]
MTSGLIPKVTLLKNHEGGRIEPMYAVIMAGGKGTRFWPKSREKMPKHLLDIVPPRTIIQETIERIAPLIPEENILIVTGESHADELIRQVPHIPQENIIIEPLGRNTAPCIGLASLHIRRKSPHDVMVVLPADHLITDALRFRDLLSIAADMASRGDYLVTIGIRPTSPETGYGYIEKGDLKAAINGENIYAVKSVREKPPLKQAKAFLKKGGFYWNSGMFVWNVDTILRAIEKWLPQINEGLIRLEDTAGTGGEREAVRRVYQTIPSISIDYGVMEKADNILLIEGDFGWSDMGSWDALWEVSDKDENGNAANCRDLFIGVNTRNSLIHSPRKLVTL